MTLQKKRLLLRAASVGLLFVSSGFVAWAVRPPVLPGEQFQRSVAKPAREAKLVQSPSLQAFAQVWTKELRRPLYPQPAPPKEPKRKEKKNPSRKRDRALAGGVRLVGTMLEDGHSMAIFTNTTGQIDLKGEGDSLELVPGTRVEQIDATQVTVSSQGRSTILELSRAGSP